MSEYLNYGKPNQTEASSKLKCHKMLKSLEMFQNLDKVESEIFGKIKFVKVAEACRMLEQALIKFTHTGKPNVHE